MNIYHKIVWIFCVIYIRETACFFEPLALTAVVSGIGAYFGYQSMKCYNECCNDNYIPQNISGLSEMLYKNLFGQHTAISPIVSALRAHVEEKNTRKALTLAFHGLAGTGKNYVAAMIRDAFYKKGIESQYFHFFNGRSEFPLEREVPRYKEHLRQTIAKALLDCPRSLFVFDEIDDMPEGVLDAIKQFMDYGSTQVWIDSSNTVVETRKAIFIFLSNTGSQQILDKSIELWTQGKSRDETSLAHFEHLIALDAFNEKGGFRRSATISSSLIDFYVPFMPLELEHVKLCIKAAFNRYGISKPTDKQMNDVMSYIKFGPDPYNLYATSGCKQIDQKVASIKYRRNSQT